MADRKTRKSGPASALGALGRDTAEVFTTFAHGDWKTRLSYLVFGFGPLMRGQIVKGLAFLGCEASFIAYMAAFGWKYLKDIGTLGTVETTKKNRVTVYGDNSFLILLFGLLTIILIGMLS